MKKQFYYHIITFGCQMNKNDSERMETILQGMGLKSTTKPEQADVILLNSCSVRESAEARVFGKTYNFAKLKEEKPSLLIAVTGCMPGRDRDGKLRAKLPWVDLFFANEAMVNLPRWLSELNPNLTPPPPSLYKGEGACNQYLEVIPTYQSNFQAFVSIQTGCNHFCSYCVVPYARGTEGNRSLSSILQEVGELSWKGYKEITLLGQIVNHYIAPDPEYFSVNNPYKKNDFAKLLWEVNQLPNIERIHWTAPHPLYMDEEVIDALTLSKQINFLHLPVQSGNTAILQKMNRRHDREYYLELIKKIRKKNPDIALGTDIIVGFSGESEAQFQDTVSLYEQCQFDISYNAQYSERSGTLAAKKFPDNVLPADKKRRWQELQTLMETIVLQKNQRYVGQEVSVLVDSCVDGQCEGNSQEMKRVNFLGSEDLLGQIVPVKINRAGEWILWGKMV